MKILSTLPVFMLLLLGACGLFNNDVKPKLPPATMEGKNTFGCLVNGKIFINEHTSFFGGNGTHAQLQGSGDTVVVNIYADSETNGGIIIAFYDTPSLQVNKIYSIADVVYTRRINNATCDYDNVISGHIKLSKFDIQNSNIIAGTFELSAYSATCKDTVTLTEGRFDIGEIMR